MVTESSWPGMGCKGAGENFLRVMEQFHILIRMVAIRHVVDKTYLTVVSTWVNCSISRLHLKKGGEKRVKVVARDS